MKKRNNETEDRRIYTDYLDLGVTNTKPFLMLSELIDNSISSFDKQYPKGWEKKLKVNINIVNTRENVIPFSEENMRYSFGIDKGSYIEILDNGFGIKSDKLVDAITLNKKNDSNASLMNVHGKGLKQSAFYFGTGLEIISKVPGNKAHRVTNLPSVEGIENPVSFWTEEVKWNKKAGTLIRISDLRENRTFNSKSGKAIKLLTKQTAEALSYRYTKLIDSKLLSITIKNNDEDAFTIKHTINDKALMEDDFAHNNSDLKNLITNFKNSVDELISESKDRDKYASYKKLAIETKNKLLKLLSGTSEERSKRVFEWEQTITLSENPKTGKNEKVLVRFWYLKKNNSDLKGLRVFEGDRAILHPPIRNGKDDQNLTYLDPLKVVSGNVDNRFAGEFNIKDISARTKGDKSTFDFDNPDDKRLFDDQIEVIFGIYERFVILGRVGKSRQGEVNKITDSDAKKGITVICEKYPYVEKGNAYYDSETKTSHIPINYEGKFYNIKMEINNGSEKSFFNIDFEDEFTLKAVIFPNHKLWKKVHENNDFNYEGLYPVYMLLVMQFIDFNKNLAKLNISKSKMEDLSFLPNISMDKIAKEIK